MPALPLELWAAILRALMSMDRPATLDIANEPFADDYMMYRPDDTQAWMQTRRTATCVCKSWRRLALPILHEVVVIYGADQLAAVAQAFETKQPVRARDSHAEAEVEEHDASATPRGALLRELYIREHPELLSQIMHRGLISGTLPEGSSVEQNILRILAHSPRLVVFSCGMQAVTLASVPRILDALGASSASLRSLDFRWAHASVVGALWRVLAKALTAFPQLESLAAPKLTSYSPNITRALETVALSALRAARLRTLVVSWPVYRLLLMVRSMSALELPALDEVHVTPVHAFGETVDAFARAPLARDALNAKVVSFAFNTTVAWDLPRLRAVFDFLACFPSLRELSVAARGVAQQGPDPAVGHPALTSFTIDCMRTPGRHDTALIDALVGDLLEGDFPQLRRVCVVPRGGKRYLGINGNAGWEDWSKRLAEKGIVLDLHAGYAVPGAH